MDIRQQSSLGDTQAVTSLRDRADATDLVSRYYAALDEHRYDEMGGYMSEDVQAVTPVGEVAGRDAVLELISRTFDDFARLHHTVGNVLVDVDLAGDRAEVRGKVIATLGHDSLRPTRSSGSVCRFGVRREAAVWRIDRIQITPTWLIEDGGSAA